MFRAAIVKMECVQAAAEFLTKIRESPVVRGRRLRINSDTRTRHRRHNSKPLKIYDGASGSQQTDHKSISETLDNNIIPEDKM